MKTYILYMLLLFFSQVTFTQETSYSENELSVNKFIDGTLTTSPGIPNSSLVIFIQGSGPTNRDGNQPMMKSDFSKKIARQLTRNGIASYRFDKRIFKMDKFNIKEEELHFDDFVEDVETILDYFRKDFSNLIIAGHSEGSLIGILAAKNKADAFISLAGAGQSIDKIIIEQIGKLAPGLQENARDALNELIETGSTKNYNPALESIFRPGVQPFMRSWIEYDPAEEIAKLDMPMLIVNGTSDLQVEPKEAELLKEAAPNAKLVVLENMNHVFRDIPGNDDLENSKSYNEPNRPLHPELIPTLVGFIKHTEEIEKE